MFLTKWLEATFAFYSPNSVAKKSMTSKLKLTLMRGQKGPKGYCEVPKYSTILYEAGKSAMDHYMRGNS